MSNLTTEILQEAIKKALEVEVRYLYVENPMLFIDYVGFDLMIEGQLYRLNTIDRNGLMMVSRPRDTGDSGPVGLDPVIGAEQAEDS